MADPGKAHSGALTSTACSLTPNNRHSHGTLASRLQPSLYRSEFQVSLRSMAPCKVRTNPSTLRVSSRNFN
jgi:hypothetical protein